MVRTLILGTAWVVATAFLYLNLVALEFYWNLFDWDPKFDLPSALLVAGLCIPLCATRYLARIRSNQVPKAVATICCLSLCLLGIYVLAAETKTTGLFARESPSPIWYRVARLFLLIQPGVFLLVHSYRRTEKPETDV